MTTVVVGLAQRAHRRPPEYHRVLPFAFWDIVLSSAMLAVFAIVAFVVLAPHVGIVVFAIASTAAVVLAEFTIPWRIDVETDGVTLYFWHRARTYDAHAVVVTHDVPSDRFVLRRRSGFPMLVRFQDEQAARALRAFVAAGVEVISR
jgi:hypothetical protein